MANRRGRASIQEEIEQQADEELPEREALSLITTEVGAPVHAAVAINADEGRFQGRRRRQRDAEQDARRPLDSQHFPALEQ